jgi:hypothetical protein
MTEPMSREEVLAGIRQEIAEQVAAAEHEADPIKPDRMLRHARSREDLAESEQAALSLRVPASLSAALKARAAAELIPTSALVRRILTQAVQQPAAPVLTVEQVEKIAGGSIASPSDFVGAGFAVSHWAWSGDRRRLRSTRGGGLEHAELLVS